MGLCGVLAYAIVEHHSAKELAASRNELSATLTRENGQMATLIQKLNAAESATAPAPQPSLISHPEAQTQVIRAMRVRGHPTSRTPVARVQNVDEPWRRQIQSQLTEQQELIAEHQREIQETKLSIEKTRTDLGSNLQSTRDDLNGAIAKNHEELVALERKGERSFYEFDLRKSKQFQREGPIRISLRKSNSKHEYCDLVMIVNDSEVSKNHVNLYEPVLFYPEGPSQPLQIVINSIGKNEARGYVSEPKYKPSELVASAPSGGTGTASGSQAAPRSSTEAGALKHRPEAQQ